MKGLLLSSLLAALAVAAPATTKRDGVTEQQLENFKLYAQWSAAAYCNSEKAAGSPVTCNLDQCSRFDSHGATVVASFTGAILDTRGFVAVDPVTKQIVVSFRGSTSVRNWIADFVFPQVKCDLVSGCKAHVGFYTSWAEVKSRVLAAVKKAKAANPSFTVAVTGHSLGGSVATLAAAYIRKAGYPADLYTYGSPRVGNEAFVNFVTEQAGGEYRMTHKDDPVPRLPPIIANFRHVSPEYWFDEGADSEVSLDEVKFCPGYASTACNGGTFGLNMDSHGWYFGGLNGCSTGETPFRRAGEISDEELEAKLNEFVSLDIQAAENLNA